MLIWATCSQESGATWCSFKRFRRNRLLMNGWRTTGGGGETSKKCLSLLFPSSHTFFHQLLFIFVCQAIIGGFPSVFTSLEEIPPSFPARGAGEQVQTEPPGPGADGGRGNERP